MPVAPQESWTSDESFASVNKVGLALTFVKPDRQPGVVVKRVKEGGAAAASGRRDANRWRGFASHDQQGSHKFGNGARRLRSALEGKTSGRRL